jgi:ABC-type transport system involved in multi-copper enzyme maturation permease subunit
MLGRVLAIAMNTYREAARARILHGLLGLAVCTCVYAVVVGAYSLGNQARVVADLGSASVSLYSIIVAIVLGATSLYRELELKTIFPILARPIPRAEYLVGKFVGTVITLSVFIVLNSGLLLFALAFLQKSIVIVSAATLFTILVLAALVAWRVPASRSWLPLFTGGLILALGSWFARDAVAESGVVLGQALLSGLEVCVVTAITLLFAAFSSPFLTAVFSLSTFVVGRSADSLAALPERVFGSGIKLVATALSRVLPNLMVYVPSRALLTGEAIGVSYWPYTGWAALSALCWVVGLLTVSTLIFERRDFL